MRHREVIMRLLFWKEDSHRDACEYECMCAQKWVIKTCPATVLCKSLEPASVSLYFTIKMGKQVQLFSQTCWNIHGNTAFKAFHLTLIQSSSLNVGCLLFCIKMMPHCWGPGIGEASPQYSVVYFSIQLCFYCINSVFGIIAIAEKWTTGNRMVSRCCWSNFEMILPTQLT